MWVRYSFFAVLLSLLSSYTSAEVDPFIVDTYEVTCAVCHAEGASSAPAAFDEDEWVSRLEQGMSVVLDHTINGFNDMPPLGSCMDCEQADFEALIQYMSTAQ